MNQNILIKDFKKYTKDGKRIAAFAEESNGNLKMFLLFCSPKDSFSKKTAKMVKEYWLAGNTEYHPLIFNIPIEEGNTAEYTFRKYMNQNFFRKKEIVSRSPVIKTILFKGDESYLVNIKKLNKI